VRDHYELVLAQRLDVIDARVGRSQTKPVAARTKP